ncbi:MAG: formate/nitrite transporter family protein, partial [Nitrospinaceae bacterium]|nr:formate/nitrite transporter family protein [Nitrospinaceae bacterium]
MFSSRLFSTVGFGRSLSWIWNCSDFFGGRSIGWNSICSFHEIDHGGQLRGALSLVIFAGSELFTGNNMVFAIGKLKNRVGMGPIIKLFTFCFVGNLLGSILLAWLVVQGGSL